MIERAAARPNLHYQVGVAEELPFAAGEFDLVSVGSAMHWFDQRRFYAECRRVLLPGGLLAVYNDHFTTHMEGVAAFHRWMRVGFGNRYPALRGMKDIDQPCAIAAGFEISQASSFNHQVSFFRDDLITYLLTRSTTLAAIHAGKATAASIAAWLQDELRPFLPDGVAGKFIFKCNLWLLRCSPSIASRGE